MGDLAGHTGASSTNILVSYSSRAAFAGQPKPAATGQLAQHLLISRRELYLGLASVLCHVSRLVSPLSRELHDLSPGGSADRQVGLSDPLQITSGQLASEISGTK
jgi:hypothetical protein